MIDKLYSLIGNTAKHATPREAERLFIIANKGEGLTHAIRDIKHACNQYLGNMVMDDERQKEFDELLKTREDLFTAIAKDKEQFTKMIQKIKWREENKKRSRGG